MKQLSKRSKAILDRALVHRDRCLRVMILLGENAADSFHLKFKGDPGSSNATREFERLISTAEN